MNNCGYIKLYRQLLESRVFLNEGLLKVWLWCLLKANHKRSWVSIITGKGSTEIEVKPGQFVFGRHSASKELGMRPTTLRGRMKKLENMQNVVMQSTSHYSLVTIVNWGEYQDASTKSVRPSDNNPTTIRQQSATDKNDKECKEEDTTIGKKFIPPSFKLVSEYCS